MNDFIHSGCKIVSEKEFQNDINVLIENLTLVDLLNELGKRDKM